MDYLEKNNSVYESGSKYEKNEFPLKEETGKIIGICMDVHKNLRTGFREVVYCDAIEEELKMKNITYEREKRFKVMYKGKALKHYFVSDFIINNNIVLEIKAQHGSVENHYRQVINYLAITNCRVGLIINFSNPSLEFKRIVL